MGAILELATDRMQAAVRLPAGDSLDPAAAWDLLGRGGVVAGIRPEAFQELAEPAPEDRVVVIATGVAPQPGRHGWAEHCIDTGIRTAIDGTIDWHEQRKMVEVDAGRELVRIHPPDPGRPGRDVTGRVLPPPPVKEVDSARIIGDGTRLVDGRVDAAISGVFQKVHGKVSVASLVPIDGDLDLHHGNIDSKFPIRITGDVRSGFIVKSQGTIEVGGAIEDARVSAQGDLIVSGGILPGHERVKAVGTVSARHIDSRVVKAGRLEVGGTVIHGILMVTGEVVARHILGGTCTCGGSMTVDVVGSPAGLPTVIQAGVDPYEQALWKAALADHDAALAAVAVARLQVNQISQRLRDHAAHGVDSGPDRAALAAALRVFEQASLRLHTGEHLVADHAARIAAAPVTSTTVTVRAVAHPGAIIGIGPTATYVVREPTRHATFRLFEGHVVMG
jgi:uncharacterized protein (DUF342 family)